MSESGRDIQSLVVALSVPASRARVCTQLAEALHVDEVLLLARDPALGILIPAPGMEQTVRGGRSWRELLASCPPQGRCEGEVELPVGTVRPALALSHGGAALVALGGTPHPAGVDDIERLMPMLAALLTSEQELTFSRDDAAAAHEDAGRAHQLAGALERARADAAALNREFREEHRRKDEFVAMLGHELRNPLAPLVTAMELIQMNGPDKPLPGNLVRIMERQVKQLTRLVDDLLDVSRVSRGHIELRRQPVQLGETLTHAYEECRALIDARGHELVMHGVDLPCTVIADPSRLTQVFCNLLNNSAKYTNQGGHISVTLDCKDGHAVVEVRDNGIGIEPDVLPHIFDLFTQASSALGRAEGGLGIGLTLVRTLVELHQGTVSAQSAGANQGVTITVTLPLAPAAAPSQMPEVTEPPQIVRADPRRVVLVDDNRDAADSAATMMRMMGHEVTIAYNGPDALLLAEVGRADLVMLDIGLPGMDGYEVARRMRSTIKRGAKLIALTGYGTDEGKRRSLEAGFDAHIVKPIHIDSLRELLAGAVAEPDRASSAR